MEHHQFISVDRSRLMVLTTASRCPNLQWGHGRMEGENDITTFPTTRTALLTKVQKPKTLTGWLADLREREKCEGEVHSAANGTKTPVKCEWRLQLRSPFLKRSVSSFPNLQTSRPFLVVIWQFIVLSKWTRLILHCVPQTIQLEHNLTS